jgi:plastocyanin
MKTRNAICSSSLVLMLSVTLMVTSRSAQAQENWNANIGAESTDMGRQALAFMPNEIWIHAGDSITWTFQSDLIHTLTLLTAGQVYPPFTVGCPGFSATPATFDGSTCVTTPPQVKGQAFTVRFPKAGNYKFECLVHQTMTGVVHVLNVGEPLPHGHHFYEEQAEAQRKRILTDTDPNMHHGDVVGGDDDSDHGFSLRVIRKHVTAGFGDETATPGGLQQLAIERFLKDRVEIHAGDTVEWGNFDPNDPHTITFGPDPANPFPPSPNVSVDSDGALHATIDGPKDNVHSGFIAAVFPDQPGLPTNSVASSPTRFRVTFTQPGTYPYHCVLHDNLGMTGTVIVLP